MPISTLSRALGCALSLGLALGCGDSRGPAAAETASTSGEAQTAGESQRDACGLITKPEADSILQAPLTPRREQKNGRSECHYEGPGGAGFSLKVFWTGGKEEMAVTKSAMKLAPAISRENGMEPTGMLALHPVADLGDEAYFNPIAGSYVRQGDVLLEFDLRLMLFQAPTQDSAIAQWRALAEQALGRL
jgi:hypothetical protein